MNWFKGLNELGKGLINLAVTIIVFAVVQPLVKGSFSWDTSVASFFILVIPISIGVFFASLKGDKNEQWGFKYLILRWRNCSFFYCST